MDQCKSRDVSESQAARRGGGGGGGREHQHRPAASEDRDACSASSPSTTRVHSIRKASGAQDSTICRVSHAEKRLSDGYKHEHSVMYNNRKMDGFCCSPSQSRLIRLRLEVSRDACEYRTREHSNTEKCSTTAHFFNKRLPVVRTCE